MRIPRSSVTAPPPFTPGRREEVEALVSDVPDA
jgi:hypothetical protein